MKLPSFTTIFSLIISAISFLYYLTIPLTDDIRVFISAAMNADRYGLDAAWEVKPIGNKFLFYGIWKLFGWIQEDWFVFAAKLAIGIVTIVICWYFATRIKAHNPFLVFGIVSVAVFLVHPFCILQSEWFAVIGSLLALALLLDDNKGYAAGVILGMVGFLKLSTFLMVVPVIIAWILLAGRKNVSIWNIIEIIEGFIGTIVVIFALCFVFLPHAIPDMLLSIDLVQANQIRPVTGDLINSLFTGIISTPADVIPILTAAIIGVMLSGVLYLGNKERKHVPILLIILMWLVSFAGAFAAREFFAYHYMVLVFPAIVTLILMREEVVIFALICAVAMASLYIVPQFGGLSGYMNFLKTADSNANEIRQIVGDQPELLYLDYGEAPFYLRIPNACRYTYPLPVQRNLSGPPADDVIRCMENYQGKYVISQPWLESITINRTVSNYLKGLTEVYNGTWQVYRRNVT